MSSRRSRLPHRKLPKQPNLEQLRKQAKDLLKNYLSGKAIAIEEVHRVEGTLRKTNFTLTDAQRVLARAYGFQSWSKLKAFIDGINIERFAEAVNEGNIVRVRSMLASRPNLVSIDRAENDEHRAIHYAVLRRDAAMARLLMGAGSDARKGIWPHRDATTALALARDRGYSEIVAIIEEEEDRRRQEKMQCSNTTISPVQDEINAAIQKGETAAAIQLLESNLTLVHACDRNGRTPLHVAAANNNVELVAWLVKRQASVNKKDLDDLTPLDHACLGVDPRNGRAKQFPATAKVLLDHDAQLTVRAVVALGDEDRVREAIRSGPSLLNQINSNGGLVSLAVKHGRLSMVRLLLDLGASVDERILLDELEEPTESWGMPLWYAALANDLAITRELLDRGADPNANVYASGWPLRNAWNHKDDSVKKLLLERGAKLQPYMIAEKHDVDEARNLLAKNPTEELAKELAWSAADHGCPEIVELALKHLNWPRDDFRWNWILIQPIRGAESNTAQNLGHFKSMDALLRHGIDPDVARFGQTPLHFVAAHHSGLSGSDRAQFAAMLVDHGANLSLRDDMLKSTPLGWACRWGRKELAELFITRGAPIEETDAEPWATPITWARKMNHMAILQLLQRD